MNFKKKLKRLKNAGVRVPQAVTGGDITGAVASGPAACPVEDEDVADISGVAASPAGASLADRLDGLFDSIDLRRALSTGWPSSLPDDYGCIAPEEQPVVFDFFRGLSAGDEGTAVSHVEHCDHCREAVGVMKTLMAATKECLHPESGDGVEAEEEAEEAEAPHYSEIGGD